MYTYPRIMPLSIYVYCHIQFMKYTHILVIMIKQQLLRLALYLHDAYCDISMWLRRCFLSIMYAACAWITRGLPPTRVIYAGIRLHSVRVIDLGGQDDPDNTANTNIMVTTTDNIVDDLAIGTRDVTPIVRGYYKYNHILSCATLDRWLKRDADIHGGQLFLMFMRNNIVRMAIIDLDNDVELLTKRDATDVSLETLPCKWLSIDNPVTGDAAEKNPQL